MSFTTKELRELLNLTDTRPLFHSEDMKNIPEIIPKLVRPRKRLTELLVEKYENPPKTGQKTLELVFLRSPKKFIGQNRIEKIELGINKLTGDDLLEKKATDTGKTEIIHTDLVVQSVGYKSVQVDKTVPFDADKGVAKSINGRIDEGFYAAGWLASGPRGVLVDTMQNAFAIAALVLEDIEKGVVRERKPGFDHIKPVLEGIQIVFWSDWLKIDAYEQREGKKRGKPREKVVDINEMLKIAAS